MGVDSRLWAKVDLGYLTNPKMSDVLDASSNAVCMHLASILHCAQHLTDGHVSPKAMTRIVGGDQKDVEILIKSGLWHESGHECDECPQPEEGRVYVHNYLNHNVSSEKINKKSEQASRAAKARWDKKKKKDSNAERNADRMQDAMQNAMLDRSDRSDQIDRETSDSSIEEYRPDIIMILDRMDQHCTDHGFKKPNRTKQNINAARLLLDKDGYNVDQVLWIINWLTKDSFWPANIRSASKLRDKFDQLKGNAKQAGNKSPDDISARAQRLQAIYDQQRMQA